MTEQFPPFNYAATCKAFSYSVPDDFNFAFDVVAKRAAEADKVALVAVDRTGEEVIHHSYSDLDKASNRFANALMAMGVEKGDPALVVLPRIPEWYHVLLGCCKTGVIAMPGTNLLKAKDLEYRIKRADAKLAIVTTAHAEAVEEIMANCPTLEHLVLVGDGPEKTALSERAEQAYCSATGGDKPY